ncbi:TPA: hypothetical protein N0F65_007839 [Lagenidium giganteum]|uniref:E3 UFM1-protein ligase 1 n=1 Tax=Lagenidium giganteum TaxID=4803 RepID=A0AAV2Z3S5_9STRA|nr:TPA: hypothetical protein N0F65_007839 [Lagenidium giganteum]
MDEIALLQAQLAAVQQQESALRLSDHNVIDLLLKLQRLGKVQIVHTLTGKQILTPLQVEREIQDYVTLNAGRVSLSTLQQLLNIDRSHVEKYVAQLAKSSRGKGGSATDSQYFVINNGEEVLTNWYLDAIMEDTNTLMQENGTMSIGELAQQYGFTVEYMKDVVMSRLGSILHAQEKSNVLYTSSFVQSQKAQIRGVYSAITRPTFVPDVVRSNRFDEKVAEEYLQELIDQRVLQGTLRGREYVPLVFLEAQRESMYSFFEQNGYLDNARANQLQVTRPFEFLKKRFPDAIALKHCVISHALQLQVEGSIEVAINDAWFVDVSAVLPSAIHPTDVALLLAKSPFVARGSAQALQICDQYAVSKAMLDACMEKFKEDAATRATKAAAERKRNSTAVQQEQPSTRGGDDLDDDDDDFAGGKRGKKGKKNAKNVQEEAPPSDRKSKRGGKGAKAANDEASKGKGGKAKKGKRGGDEPSSTGGDSSKRGAAGVVSIVPSREEMSELLVGWFDALEGDETLIEGVIDHLEADIDVVYSSALQAAMSSIIRGDAASLRELRKKFEDRFDDLYSLLLVLEKGFNKLQLQVDAKDQALTEALALVEKHLLEASCVELTACTTSFVAESNSLELEGVPPFTPPAADDGQEHSNVEPMTSLSEENKKALEKNLPASTASALVRMWTLSTAGRLSLSDFMLHISVLAEALSMPLRKMDRKKERQIIFAYRHTTVQDLEATTTCTTHAAALVLQLFFQQATGLPAKFPRDAMGFAQVVLEAFRPSTPPAALEKLEELVQLACAGEWDTHWSGLLAEAQRLVTAKDIAAALEQEQ